jgi:hypothetical protein
MAQALHARQAVSVKHLTVGVLIVWFVVWNVLGLMDLMVAVSLGILASGTPLGILAGDVSTRLMGMFPLSLIPTFFVPLLVIPHLVSLIRVAPQ